MKRVLIKLSGEALQGPDVSEHYIDPDFATSIVSQLVQLQRAGIEVVVVVGGGNICRGRALMRDGFSKLASDNIGMLATMMNAIFMQDLIAKNAAPARAMSALPMGGLIEAYTPSRANECLASGELLVLGGGVGNPIFTTDTAACLRAIELNADCVVKCTMVDGVYDSDPKHNPKAKKIANPTYQEVIELGLAVMDASAFVLASEHEVPIYVCDIFSHNVLVDLILNQRELGSLIGKEKIR